MEISRSGWNVLLGLNGDGLNRLEEAEQEAAEALAEGDMRPFAAVDELRTRVKEGGIDCDCQECGSWDGLDRRCSCGNRRTCWEWNDWPDGTGNWSPSCY